VVHQSSSQSVAFYTAGWYGLRDIRNETGRRLRPAGQHPLECLKQPMRLRSIGIVEALSIKVPRISRIACTPLHDHHLSLHSTRKLLIRNGSVGGMRLIC